MNKFPITQKGLIKLEEELRTLKHKDRPEIIQAISVARDQGDLSENAEYHAAREKQSFIEGRISELEDKASRAEVIEIEHLSGSNTILFGATVYLVDEDTEEKKKFTIVGEYETDISKGLISTASPLGRALISKQVGDIIEVVTPRGTVNYEVLQIEYKDIEI
jgi:transcription elongation factor GreA